MGTASRDYLRQLLNSSNGQIIMTAVEQDQYGRTVAEVFVPVHNFAHGDEEILVNAQMIKEGVAYIYPQYVGGCPNRSRMKVIENEAKKAHQACGSKALQHNALGIIVEADKAACNP